MAYKPRKSRIPPSKIKVAAQSQGITKSSSIPPLRRSLRLVSDQPKLIISPDDTQALERDLNIKKTTKRGHEHLEDVPNNTGYKRHKASLEHAQKDSHVLQDPIEHWRRQGNWPKELFEPYPMAHLLARKMSTASIGRKRSIDGSTISSITGNDNTRAEKSAPYQNPMYEEQLKLKGIYMRADPIPPNETSIKEYKDLLAMTPILPQDTLFMDSLFLRTCENISSKNECRVIRDIAELIVPSAENLCSRGEISLTELTESVNEGWSLTDSITPVRPQPDFSVGFRREAFTEEQLAKIRPILGDSRTQFSRFRATWYMYFPFLACEVKCGSAALDIADRQNAHSMGIAVRAMVDLFELVGRRQEVDRQILAYSVSHDHRSVRTYGYYPIFQADKVTYHRHLIHSLDIQVGEGKDKWTIYRFIKSIYQAWAPTHLQRIRAILDELPADITGLVSPPSLSTGLSQ